VSTRWSSSDAPRGDAYDARWRRLGAQGQSIHGEADLVDALLRQHDGRRVLDAGCGTGRVAIELSVRGYDVVGVDVDPAMLTTARTKAPALHWIEADLADLTDLDELAPGFDAAVMAGNVVIFLAPGSEATVLGALYARLRPGGLLVAGFQLHPARLSLAHYDALADGAGFVLAQRWSTWERAPFTGGDYAVSVHVARPSDDAAAPLPGALGQVPHSETGSHGPVVRADG
jgi:SAM-dependent methyltransferase